MQNTVHLVCTCEQDVAWKHMQEQNLMVDIQNIHNVQTTAEIAIWFLYVQVPKLVEGFSAWDVLFVGQVYSL